MSREDKFFLITLAEQSGRYEDARFYFLAFLDDYSDLSHLERNSLYITYRKLISARRNA